MCGAATPQEIDRNTGKSAAALTPTVTRDLTRLQRALGDHHELGPVIGRGGFAEVFLVRDLRLKRDLALKALRPDLLISDALLTRFRREAETIAALRHPHIVPIYDIGEADGIAYILMPFIKGESLKALLQREGPRPPREAIRGKAFTYDMVVKSRKGSVKLKVESGPAERGQWAARSCAETGWVRSQDLPTWPANSLLRYGAGRCRHHWRPCPDQRVE